MATVCVSLFGKTLAESRDTIVLEGNHYFPPESLVDESLLSESDFSTVCHWKGTASYYNAKIEGKPEVKDVAWYYANPKEEAEAIKGYVAFYKNKVDFETDF